MHFRTLLADLASVTRNRVRMGGHTLRHTADPTPLRHRAFELLQVSLQPTDPVPRSPKTPLSHLECVSYLALWCGISAKGTKEPIDQSRLVPSRARYILFDVAAAVTPYALADASPVEEISSAPVSFNKSFALEISSEVSQ